MELYGMHSCGLAFYHSMQSLSFFLFLLLWDIPLNEYAIIYLPILLLMDIWPHREVRGQEQSKPSQTSALAVV